MTKPSTATTEIATERLPEERQDRVGWAYEVARETEKAEARFDAWAENYDQDVADLLGWQSPEATIGFVTQYVSRDARILDAGAGTGLMGALMRREGYNTLIGTDISSKMLAVAREKAIYTEDFQADLTEPLPLEDASFDCVVSVGVSGYMTAATLNEFARIVKPGGHIIYTISDSHFEEHGFKDVLGGLVTNGRASIVEQGAEFAAIPKSEPNHKARVHVYQVL